MENRRHSSAAPPNGAKGGSGSGCPENKDVAAPNHSLAAEVVVATVATSDDDGLCKGNKNVAADIKELKPHIVAERKRRDRMRDYFGELLALMPQIPAKSDKGTIVGHAVDYIQSLEKTKAMLEKRKQELALARQAAAEPAASSSSAPPPQLPTAAGRQVGFQTWSWPNLVLNVSDDKAYISVCAPRLLGMQNMVMVLSVLSKHGIDVVTAQVDSDAVRSVFIIYARVTTMDEENPSVEDVYKLAVSEILVWLNIIN